jgi:hypothetical protein
MVLFFFIFKTPPLFFYYKIFFQTCESDHSHRALFSRPLTLLAHLCFLLKGSDNVVADVLNRYPDETGQSCDHLLLGEHDMDLVCHFFNLSSELSMHDFGSLSQDETVPHVDVSLKGNGADLLDSSTTPRAYSENVLEDLTLRLD